MDNKRIFVSLIILMFLVGISFVSAQDISSLEEVSSMEVADDVISVDDTVDDVSTSDVDDEVISDSGSTQYANSWADLKSDVEDSSVDTVKLNASDIAPSSSSSDQISINHDVTIVGEEGSYIGSADWNSAPVYNYIPIVTSGNNLNVKFENVTFQYLSNNVFMKLMGNGNYAFKNCVFNNINCTGSHQSVIWLNYGYALLENCTFTNIKSSYGAITNYYTSWGTAVNNARMTVKDCEFYDNIGLSEPGCINNCGYLEVYDSTFEDNSASWWAGAIHTHNYANTSIWNSVFRNNKAGWNGGALYAYSDLQVYNSTFIENTCTGQYGGGAIGSSNRVRVTVDNCLFKNNNAPNSAGGAIWANGAGYLNVTDSEFINNTAPVNKGMDIYYSYTGSSSTAAYFNCYYNDFYGANNATYSIYTSNSYLNVNGMDTNNFYDIGDYVEPSEENDTNGSSGTVIVPDNFNGTQLWNASLSGALGGTPLIDGDVIYVPNGHSIYCLNITNGALIWSASSPWTDYPDYDNFHDLALHNGVLVAPCDMDKLYFFDAATGSEVNATSDMWKASSKYGVLINDDTIYVSSEYPYGENGNAWIAVIKQVNGVYTYMGSILEINGVENYALLSAPVLWNNYLWVNTVNGLMRVDLTTNTSSIVLSDTVGKPVAGGSYLYILTSNNHIRGIDSTGSVVKDITVAGNVGSTLAINSANTVLYTVNAEGSIYAAKTTDSLATFIYEINPVSSALIVGDDGYLYVGDNAGILWVFDIVQTMFGLRGNVVWAYNLTSMAQGGLLFNTNIIYVGTNDTFYVLCDSLNNINILSSIYSTNVQKMFINELLSVNYLDNILSNSVIVDNEILPWGIFSTSNTIYELINENYYFESTNYNGLLIGTDGMNPINNIIIRPKDNKKVRIISRNSDKNGIWIAGGNNITLENIIFTGDSNINFPVFIISLGANVTIKNCIFENYNNLARGRELILVGKMDPNQGSAIEATFENCQFINCSAMSYFLKVDNTNIIFKGCTFDNVSSITNYPIYFENVNVDWEDISIINSNTKTVFSIGGTNKLFNVNFKVLTESLTLGEAGSIVGELVDDNGNRIYSQNLKFLIDDGEPIAPTSFDKATGLYTLSYTPDTNRDVKVSAVCSNVEVLDVEADYIPVKAVAGLTLNVTDSSVYGSEVVVNATLNSTISGESIVFNITDSSGEVVKSITSDITNGFASESFADLAAGDYTLTAVYAGDDDFAPATISKAFTINKADSSIALSVLGDDVYVGDAIGVQAVLPSSATGSVSFRLKDSQQIITVSGEAASAIFAGLAEGEYTVYATYSGDDNYKESDEVNTTFTVIKKDVSFYVDASWVSLGEDAEIDVYDLPDDATGNITYYINSFDPEVRDVDESLTLSDLPIGKYSVRAVYSGDDKYNGGEATDDFEVYYDLELEEDEFSYGDDALINITFPDELNGNLGVIVDGNASSAITTNVVNGSVVFTLSGLAPGEHTLDLTYQGDKPFETTATINVAPKISSLDDLTTGDNTISLNLPSDATGNMTIRVDDNDPVVVVAVVNGTASYDLNNLSAGDHEISVSYEGNYPSFSTYKDVSVAKATPASSVKAPASITAGQTVTIPISLPSDATGVVLVDVDGKKYYAEVANGVASVAVAGLTAGNKVLTYKYLGDSKYAASTGSATLKVVAPKAADKITLTLKKVTVKRSAKKLVIKATLKINGKAKKGLKVTFKFKGKKYTAKTNAKGVAKITVKKSVLKKLKKGKKVTYTATYGKTTAKKTVKVKK